MTLENMCGRYVLSMRPSQVRQRLAEQSMPADDAPDDGDGQLRQSYNFCPGYHGLIYRADTSDGNEHAAGNDENEVVVHRVRYKLQAAKWGLVPFWTKRPPDYGSQMRTINCRDDSLIENRGMWNTMKQRKRCVVVADGFYEWLKKNNGKEKLPHYVKRKDGQLLCFAGLWDMVQYEGSEDKLYTYTIITTDSNKQLKFLHDRMPVILEAGSEEMKTWLDPDLIGWNKDLQSMLRPFGGEFVCYPVDKAVGKVGNNSPQFVVPIDSTENKSNIANFFSNQKAKANQIAVKNEDGVKAEKSNEPPKIEKHIDETRDTAVETETTEDNAPLPKPKDKSDHELSIHINQETAEIQDEDLAHAANESVDRGIKREISEIDDNALLHTAESPPKKAIKLEKQSPSAGKTTHTPGKPVGGRKTRSATSNNTVVKTPPKDGNAKITSFFGK
jgi:putative SOS response-associated peptidase YedK